VDLFPIEPPALSRFADPYDPELPPTALPLHGEGSLATRQAEEDTPQEKASKRSMPESETLLNKPESVEHNNPLEDKDPGRAEARGGLERMSQTCLICRVKRVYTTAAEQTTTRYVENECSRWYAANVELHHNHVWERGTCVFMSNPVGGDLTLCNAGHYPIWLLSPTTQLAVYQHFKNPIDARDLFLSLADVKTYNDRLEEDWNKGELTVFALWDWEAAGFPGTWKKWWESWYKKHIVQHNEFLAWLHSASTVSFEDWQRQRKLGQGAAAPASKLKK
jgi:hypothetical protein